MAPPSAIEQLLIAFFTSTTYVAKDIAALIGKRAHYGKIPRNQSNTFPRLFLSRSDKDYMVDLDGTGRGTYIEDSFDLEVISNASSDILAITSYLYSSVHCHYGSISALNTVKGIFIENQDDSYEPKGISADSGLDVAAFLMRVIHAST